MMNRSDSTNGHGALGTSQGFSVYGFTPINGSSTLGTSSLIPAQDPPPPELKDRASRQRRANASAKRKSESRKGIQDSSLQLTETQPAEVLEFQTSLPAANTSRSTKRRRTTTQESAKSNSNDIAASLKRVKSGSHLFLTSEATFPSLTSTSLLSPYSTTKYSKDDSPIALSSTPARKLFSFMYHQPRSERFNAGNTVDSMRESNLDRRHVLASNSNLNEGGPDITIPADHRTQYLVLGPEGPKVSVTNHVLEEETFNVGRLPIDENALFEELYSHKITPDMSAEDLNLFPDYPANEDSLTPGPKELPMDAMDAMSGFETPKLDERTLSDLDLPPETQLLVPPMDNYDTSINDEDWMVAIETNHETTDNIDTRTPHARSLSQGTDEFDAVLGDEDWNILYEGVEGPMGEEFGENPAGNLLSDDVNLSPELGEFDDGLGDEDWNAEYDVHTAVSLEAMLPLPHLTPPHKEITGRLRDDCNLSPSAPYQTSTGLNTTFKPLTGISMGDGDEDDGDEFDNDFDEKVLLQAEAEVLISGDPATDESESDIDESLLLQAELCASTTLPSRNMYIQEPPTSLSGSLISSRTQNKTSNLGSKQDHYTNGRNNLQEPSVEDGLGKIHSSPISIITIASSSSPSLIRNSPEPMSRVVHKMQAFVRHLFPTSVTKRSVIHGLSNKTMLRVCFRVGEIFKAGSSQRNSDTTVLIEFYAAVIHSRRCGSSQEFHFADLFFSTRPPFIQGFYEGWKGIEPNEHDSSRFLDTSPARMKMCRAVGTLTRSVRGKLILKVINIWEASWDDVKWVRGIVSP